MFWLTRPPYLRWAAMGLVLVVAFAVDMGDQTTEPRPFAARDISQGEGIDDAVEWREVITGGWDDVAVDGRVASVDIRRGDPITASMLSTSAPPPQDWWSVELALPSDASVGSRARVVVTDPILTVDGIVVSVDDGGTFGAATTGLVALPPASAAAVARASSSGRIAVLLGRPGL